MKTPWYESDGSQVSGPGTQSGNENRSGCVLHPTVNASAISSKRLKQFIVVAVITNSYQEFRPTLAQLRAFAAIATHGHFREAAAKLGISQPSLSQALAALENGVGIQLVERSTRKVMLTGAGREILPYAEKIIDGAEAFMGQARRFGGTLAGPLNIGVIPTIAPFILPQLLVMLNNEFPELEPKVVEDRTAHLRAALSNGDIDIALMSPPVEKAGLSQIDLYDEEFYLLLPSEHELEGREDVPTEILRSLDLLLLDEGHCLRDQVLDVCRLVQAEAQAESADTRTASLSTLVYCVAGGLGTTLLPASAIAFEGRREGVSFARFAPGERPARTVSLYYRSNFGLDEQLAHFGDIVHSAWQMALAEGGLEESELS